MWLQLLFRFSERHLILLKETYFTWPLGCGRTFCILFFITLSSWLAFFLSPFFFFFYYFSTFSEGRLANAQAGVFCYVCFWAELESLGDREANSEDPCQAGEQEAKLGRYVPTLGNDDWPTVSLQSTHVLASCNTWALNELTIRLLQQHQGHHSPARDFWREMAKG